MRALGTPLKVKIEEVVKVKIEIIKIEIGSIKISTSNNSISLLNPV